MTKKAVFAGGCFWCMVKPFEKQPGIISVTSGYTGGHVPNPTYEQVTTGTTGHTEAVEIEYDPEVISYDQLVEIYWQQTDPTDALGQFADRGDSYRPVIYYSDEEERNIAERSKQALQDSGRFDKPIVTKSNQEANFILQKIIIRIITRKTSSITIFIEKVLDVPVSFVDIGATRNKKPKKLLLEHCISEVVTSRLSQPFSIPKMKDDQQGTTQKRNERQLFQLFYDR